LTHKVWQIHMGAIMGAVLEITVPGWLFWCQLAMADPVAPSNTVHCELHFWGNGLALPAATSAFGSSAFWNSGSEQLASSNFSSHTKGELSS